MTHRQSQKICVTLHINCTHADEGQDIRTIKSQNFLVAADLVLLSALLGNSSICL